MACKSEFENVLYISFTIKSNLFNVNLFKTDNMKGGLIKKNTCC